MIWQEIIRKYKEFIQGYEKKINHDNFDIALKFTLGAEGGYANSSIDRGGETNKGVTWRVYNSYRRLKGLPIRSVKEITDAEVREIYREMYWDKVCGDKLPTKIAVAVFDWGVNSGPHRAVKKLQACLGIVEDGIVGPVTAQEAREADEKDLLESYLDSREKFYYAIGQGGQEVFLKGWLNRLNNLRTYLKELT